MRPDEPNKPNKKLMFLRRTKKTLRMEITLLAWWGS